MRARIPYYLILPGTDGFREDHALLHDYALIFPEKRKPALLHAGFRLNNHPAIWGRQDFLKAKKLFYTADLGPARVGLLQADSFLHEILPEMESLLTRFRTFYNIERIQGLDLPYM
jgi:hypothetical protein